MARHHRCNLCGKDFDTGEALKDHVAKRHPEEDVHWWVVAEDPARDLKFFPMIGVSSQILQSVCHLPIGIAQRRGPFSEHREMNPRLVEPPKPWG